jgi:hypothetical protein
VGIIFMRKICTERLLYIYSNFSRYCRPWLINSSRHWSVIICLTFSYRPNATTPSLMIVRTTKSFSVFFHRLWYVSLYQKQCAFDSHTSQSIFFKKCQTNDCGSMIRTVSYLKVIKAREIAINIWKTFYAVSSHWKNTKFLWYSWHR